MSQSTKRTTRPPAVAPAGRLTIAEAADALSMSYSGVYRHIDAGTVPFEQDESNVITIARADLGKIRAAKRKPASGDSQGVFVRQPKATIARWERAIKATTKPGEKPIAVSRWLVDLAENATKRAGV